jgi:acyl dehydratase
MNLGENNDKEFYEEVLSFSSEDVIDFARISGDYNPLHLDEKFALAQGFENRIVHGALVISKVSGIIASKFPGPGTIIGTIDWKFLSPVFINQELKLKFALSQTGTRKGLLELTALDDSRKVIQEARIVIFFAI